MNCPTCHSDIPEGTKFCPFCGNATTQNDSPQQSPAYQADATNQTGYSQPDYQQDYQQDYRQNYQQNYQQSYTYPTYPSAPASATITPDQLPPQYKPISAWGYFGYSLLFTLPVAGFVLLIVFSCSRANINRRNYARSYFCGLLIVGTVALIALVISLIAKVNIFRFLESPSYYYY